MTSPPLDPFRNNWTRYFQQPRYRHVFKLISGEVLVLDPHDVKATIDRHPLGQPVRVWEITSEGGFIRRLWPEEILSWDQEAI